MTVPDVHLEPRLDDDARTVIAAADHVAELLPVQESRTGANVERGFTVRSRLDPVTLAAMKEMMKHVV